MLALKGMGLVTKLATRSGAVWCDDAFDPAASDDGEPDDVASAATIEYASVEVCSSEIVDDLLLGCVAPSVDEVDTVGGIMVDVLAGAAQRFALRLNWGRGKSEMMGIVSGPGAATWRRDHPPGTPVQSPKGRTVLTTTCYKHVGTVMDHMGSAEPAVAHRCQTGCLALAKVGPILSTPSLGEATRVLLSRSLVSSVVVHDLEIVEGITEAQGRRLEHVQMQGLRRATHTVRFDAKSAKPSDEDIRRRTGVPSVESVQRSRRLLHLARVQAGHFGALRAMLQSCPGRWGHV